MKYPKIGVRCQECNAISVVNYAGEEMRCPRCGGILLAKNDSRIEELPLDSACEAIVIGDDVDEILNKLSAEEEDELFASYCAQEESDREHALSQASVPLKNAKVSDLVHFGDDYWIVIGEKDGVKLLLAKEWTNMDVEAKDSSDAAIWALFDEDTPDPYADGLYPPSGEDLRAYLNGYFLEKHFSEEDRAQIIPHEIEFDGQKDKIFLLSKDEVEKYLSTPESRISTKKLLGNDVARAWLLRRTSPAEPSFAVSLNGEFEVIPQGLYCEWIRPALWVACK